MLYPSIDLLRTKVDSRYTLCSLASKRARDLIDGKPAILGDSRERPVSVATDEIAADLISYIRDPEDAEELDLEEEREAELSDSDGEGSPETDPNEHAVYTQTTDEPAEAENERAESEETQEEESDSAGADIAVSDDGNGVTA